MSENLEGLLDELSGRFTRTAGSTWSKWAQRWAFRTAPGSGTARMSDGERGRTQTARRVAVETLAIIAYHQPVTRAEVEEIRGVALSRGTLDTLLEAGWIKPKGRRRTPGKPVTWGTTDDFLDHFGLESLEALAGALRN